MIFNNKKYDSNFALSMMTDANVMDEPMAGFSGRDMTANAHPHSSNADGDGKTKLDWNVLLGEVINAGGNVAASAVRRPDITTPQSQAPQTFAVVPTPPEKKGMSTGTIISIAVGAILLTGLIAIIAMKK